MPYQVHPSATTPPDSTVIWRYMDLTKFLVMLEQRALYFALTRELGDSWEAVLARSTTDLIANTMGPSLSGGVVANFAQLAHLAGVNCWYQGTGESVAMWSLYTSKANGIAIRSDVGRFKRALQEAKRDVILGAIRYEDHDLVRSDSGSQSSLSPGRLNALSPLLQKRVCYKHECELRAVTIIEGPYREALFPGTTFVCPHLEHGVSVDVDLAMLIESVTLCPGFPGWATNLLRAALGRAGIAPSVVDSEVTKPAPPLGL